MHKLKALAVAVCGSVALLSAVPASADEWSQARSVYHTGKYYAKQAAKAVVNFVIPSAHAVSCGNNGFGNGGGDPAPGNSGTNGSPNSGEKLEDVVRSL